MSEILHRLPEFIGNHTLLAMLFLSVLVAWLGSEAARLFRGYREITPAALTQLINRDSPLVVDLSSTLDFEKGHIPGARHVPLSQFDPENKDLAKVRELPVAVYCKTGTTSAQAAARWSRPDSSVCSGSAAAGVLAAGRLAAGPRPVRHHTFRGEAASAPLARVQCMAHRGIIRDSP
jgi:rhodanese-related sulfurtransferase